MPPAGVRPFEKIRMPEVKAARINGTKLVPEHQLITHYRYNSLGQVVAQNSPDANTSKFWYDKIGRLAVSQNAEQAAAATKRYSYTIYDDLGRITEVGEKEQNTQMTQVIGQDECQLKNWILANGGATRKQITNTIYDHAYGEDITPPITILDELITQGNLRNRVSYSVTRDNASDPANYHTATFYTYDIHGNVSSLVQDYKGVAAMNVQPTDRSSSSGMIMTLSVEK